MIRGGDALRTGVRQANPWEAITPAVTEFTVDVVIPEDCDMDEAGETVAVEVDESEYVLAAARTQGVWLPAFCQQGWCTTCAAELLDGEVDQSDARRYYDVDAEEGFILPCTGKPESDLRIRACREDAMREHRDAHDLPP